MYTEIILETELQFAEALSDALVQAGALAASVEDAEAGSSNEEPLFGEPGSEARQQGWRLSRIVVLFDANAQIEAVLERAREDAGLAALPSWRSRAVPEADWVRLTQAQFDPIAIGRRLWVVPSWHDRPAEIGANAVILKLDPGLAFGTGAHPTTRLCLNWLEDEMKPGQSLIDYGCGSGILAIAAKKLGAGRVQGTDIDPQALRASIDNARENQCDVDFLPAEDLMPAADIVIANILSNPLQVLAPLLCGLLAPGGSLVLSGVLERQAAEVSAAYQSWLTLDIWGRSEGWVCLAARRLDGDT
jgi:ribosomal protein L11 methyltransferase